MDDGKSKVPAIKICQASTGDSYRTGKKSKNEHNMSNIYNRTFDLLGEDKKKKKKGAVKIRHIDHSNDPEWEADHAADELTWDPKLKTHITPTLPKSKELKSGDKGYDRKADLKAPMTPEDEANLKKADTPMRAMKVAAQADPEGAKKLVGKEPVSAADKENLLLKVAQHKAAKRRAKRKAAGTKQGTLRGERGYIPKRAAETVYRGVVQGLGGGSESHHVGDARRKRNENMTNDVYSRMLILMEDDLDEAANIARGLGYFTPKFLRPKAVRVRSARGHSFPSQHPGLANTGHPGTTDRSTGRHTAPVRGRTGTAEPDDTMVRPNAPSSRSRTHVNLQDVAKRGFDDSSLPKRFQRKKRQSVNLGGSFMDQFRTGLINRAASDAAKRRVATKSSVKRRVSGPEGSKGPYGSKSGSRLSAQRSTASPEATAGFAAAQKAKRAEARDARRAARHPNRAKLQHRSTDVVTAEPTSNGGGSNKNTGPGRIERGTGLNPEQQKAFATSFQGATELAAKDRKPSHSAGGNGGPKPETPRSGGGGGHSLTGDGSRRSNDPIGAHHSAGGNGGRKPKSASKVGSLLTTVAKGVGQGRTDAQIAANQPLTGDGTSRERVGAAKKESTSYLRMAKLLETVTISTAGTGARTISGKEKMRKRLTTMQKVAPQKQMGSVAGGSEYGTRV